MIGHFYSYNALQAKLGIEGEHEGNCYLVGEHTSIDFQGYLNGAVETGERAVSEVIGDIRATAELAAKYCA